MSKTDNDLNNTFTTNSDNTCAVIVNGRLERFDDTVSTDLVIPEGVTTIAFDAFKGCSRLKELTVPESMEEIEPGAFDDCTELSVINVPDNFTLLDVYDLYGIKWYRDRRENDFVILGYSHSVIRYSFRPHMCNVWVCDTSHVKVDVKYGAFVMVHLFDKASADIVTDLVSKVTVIRHSPDAKVKKEGVVTVKNEFHYLK